MAKLKFTPEFDDSQLIAALSKFESTTDEMEAALNDLEQTLSKSFNTAAEDIKKLDDLIKDLTEELDAVKLALKEADAKAKGFSSTLLGAAKDVKVFGVTLGDAQELLGKKVKALREVAQSIKKVNSALKLFKLALVSTGIGAIVLAFGALVSLLTKTQGGLDFVNKILAQGQAIVSVFVDRLSGLGEAIVKFFRRDFKGASEEARRAFSGVVDEIQKEAKAAGELEIASQRLRDKQRELNVEFAKQEAQIEALRNASIDETLTLSEREAKLKEALELQKKLETKRIELAEENLRIIKEQNGLGESLADDLDKQAQAEIDLFNIRKESASRQREDLSQLQALRIQAADEYRKRQEEELKRVQELTKEYERLVDAVEQRASSASLRSLTGLDRLNAEQELAIAEIERFRNEVIAKAAELGTELPADFEDNIQVLFDEVGRIYADEVRKLRKELFDEAQNEGLSSVNDPLGLLQTKPTDPAFEKIKNLGRQVLSDAAERMRPALVRIKESLLAAFGITEEEANQIVSSTVELFDSLNQLQQAQLDQELASIDRVVAKRQEAVDILRGQLEEEQKLKAAGDANDVAALQSKLNQETRLLDQEQQRRLELERKAANRQLLIDSLLQASQITLAAAKLAASEASKGVIGIVTALSGLALLTTIIARAKSNAIELSEPEQLRKGKKLEGPSHENGGVPLNVDGRLYEAEGGEWLIGSAPSKIHDDFLAKLNSGKYNNIPLHDLAEMARNSRFGSVVSHTKDQRKRFEEAEINSRYQRMENVFRDGMVELGDRVVDELKNHPQYFNKQGRLFRRWSTGDLDEIV